MGILARIIVFGSFGQGWAHFVFDGFLWFTTNRRLSSLHFVPFFSETRHLGGSSRATVFWIVLLQTARRTNCTSSFSRPSFPCCPIASSLKWNGSRLPNLLCVFSNEIPVAIACDWRRAKTGKGQHTAAAANGGWYTFGFFSCCLAGINVRLLPFSILTLK